MTEDDLGDCMKSAANYFIYISGIKYDKRHLKYESMQRELLEESRAKLKKELSAKLGTKNLRFLDSLIEKMITGDQDDKHYQHYKYRVSAIEPKTKARFNLGTISLIVHDRGDYCQGKQYENSYYFSFDSKVVKRFPKIKKTLNQRDIMYFL